MFIDATGDGWLGYFAGAKFRHGRESRAEFGESHAPEQADKINMSGCLMGELCLSPIGLSMVTKLAPVRLVGLGMGGWFLSTGIGNNLSGIFASVVSGETGMTTSSALSGYTFGFWALVGSGVVLFLLAPFIQRLMHGVK